MTILLERMMRGGEGCVRRGEEPVVERMRAPRAQPKCFLPPSRDLVPQPHAKVDPTSAERGNPRMRK